MGRTSRGTAGVDEVQNQRIEVLEQEIPPPTSAPGKILRSTTDGSGYELNAVLNDLHDVEGTPSEGRALMYTGSNWAPMSIPVQKLAGMNVPSLGGLGSGFGFSFNTATQVFDTAQPQLANLAEVALPAVNTIADGAALVFDTVDSQFKPGTVAAGGGQTVCSNVTTSTLTGSASTTSFYHLSDFDVVITPSSASKKMLLRCVVYMGQSGDTPYYQAIVKRKVGSSTVNLVHTTAQATQCSFAMRTHSTSSYACNCMAWEYLDEPNTTSEITYELHFRTGQGTWYLNRNAHATATGNVINPTATSALSATEV